ncbi:hypothetical protein Afil01_67840 [Actinorhabdospora filicis]|uniref:DIP1984 family protein n=1 Tax=Actinorhabdospora filicis TaxID=1785913 RepID=A0A9W6SUB8_9ACTN|nr:DIP1984 family protein [Actinorhabdospora filicis]GLZ81977.1 hypothetical protein Afil01_67840 [Actinorhabdospora filicis]
MKLAEALAERADAARRVEELRARVLGNARYQEGETPTEDAAALLDEVARVLARLEYLMGRINRTNAEVHIDAMTLTEALARRDVLRLHHGVLTSAADAAATGGYQRQLRSELKMLSALSVADLRARADEVARELRELDLRVQRANWEADLLE